jgi:hypothetical protein
MGRWKKQIFTEAEMVEQAVSADATKEKDLIDLETRPESTEITAQQLDDKSRPEDATKPDAAPKPDDRSGPDEGDLATAEPTSRAEETADPVPEVPATETETTGYDVDQTDSHPETYADAVKEHTREVTIQEEVEPESPVASAQPDESAGTPNQGEGESATLLDKGKGKAESPTSAQVDSPSTPAKSSVQTDEARDQVPSPRRPAATPTRDRPVSFPAMPRSVSHNSELMSPQSGTSTPSRSPSHANLSESVSNTSSGPGLETPDGKGGKTRKRLTSLKKMVRRISDQGSGLVRSNSTGRGGGLASPSPDAGDVKERLPLQRGDSAGPGPQ